MANLCREAALGPIRSMAFGEIENISADQVSLCVTCVLSYTFDDIRNRNFRVNLCVT